MDTSKTECIKSLLLKAWRERWTDIEWGINIKKVLPRGVSGDIYNLADCILQQAVIGPVPNQLVLSYLQHSLSSQVVSYGAVLSSIENLQLFHKPHCILAILKLLKSVQRRISCHGNTDECILLCNSMVSITLWLFTCVFKSLQKIIEVKTSQEHQQIVEDACIVLKSFGESTFFKALLYIGKHDDSVTYEKMIQMCNEVENILSQVPSSSQVPKDTVENSIKEMCNLETGLGIGERKFSVMDKSPHIEALGALICLEAILNPTKDVSCFVDQILLLQKLQGMSLSVLYSEIIKACFIGLIDSLGTTDELKWTAFMFLKVPQILLRIHNARHTSSELKSYSVELEEALNLVLGSGSLLDCSDMKANCDCLQFLLIELNKVNLLTDNQVKKLLVRRQNESQNLGKNMKVSQSCSQPPQASLILRAEPTVTSILKTLDADYSKNQEGLLSVLCKMLSGKSFDLILAAAAATGKLHILAVKLIKFNEFSKEIIGENSKASQIRALLFDISFLMLCYITQQYGSEIVLSSNQTRDSFFETWVTDYFPEGGSYKPPDLMLNKTDSNKVDFLLSQFTSTDGDIKTSLVKWHEVCVNAPAAIKEVLTAWEHGAVSTDLVKLILDTVKTKMLCLPVCISTWLCSYINIAHHDERLKPMNMLQQFMTPYIPDNSSGSDGNVDSQSNMYYKERSFLLHTIIKKMLYDLHPPNQSTSGRPHKLTPTSVHHALVSRQPYGEIVEGAFQSIHSRGRLDIKSMHTFCSLLAVGGTMQFVNTIVKEMLKFEHQSDLYVAVDLAFALFHLDIEQCALSLILHFLPRTMYNHSKHSTLTEPYGTAMAKLTVMVIFSALESIVFKQSNRPKKSRKRVHQDFLVDEMCEMLDFTFERPAKYRKVTGHSDIIDVQPIGMGSGDHLDISPSEPLYKTINEFFQMFVDILCEPILTPCTNYVYSFLKEIVECRRNGVKNVLHFVPLSLVSQLIRCTPDEVNQDVVLLLCDTQNPRSRKITAKSICQLHSCQAKITSFIRS